MRSLSVPMCLSVAIGCLGLATLTDAALRQSDRQLIIGGIDAHPDRYPYYVRLDWNGQFICGGSLITQDFVLTAAHCLLGDLTVTIDAHTLTETSESLTRSVTRKLRHPGYDEAIWFGRSFINDAALLQIEGPANGDAAPILPTIQLNKDRSIPGEDVSVTSIGLGVTSSSSSILDLVTGKSPASTLQEVELKVIDDDVCDAEYKGLLHQKSMICAMDPGQSSCSGDSGGPLLMLGVGGEDGATEESSVSTAWENDVQVGVVSFGVRECVHETIPLVYTEVAYVYPWIESQLCRYSIDPPVGCRNVTDSIILERDECRDYPGAFYVNWFFRFQRCEWLAGKQGHYCSPDREAWLHCPLTCHSCTYEPEDEHIDLETFSEDSLNYIEGSDAGIMTMLVIVFPIVVGAMCTGLIALQICVYCLYRDQRQLEDELEQLKSGDAVPLEIAEPPPSSSSNIIQGSVILPASDVVQGRAILR